MSSDCSIPNCVHDRSTSLLHKMFPDVFSATERPQYFPYPAGFMKFLRSKLRRSQAREVVLDLMLLLPFTGGSTTATVSDHTLAERTGIDRRDIQDVRKDPVFQALVHVSPGKPWKAKTRRTATSYDLRKMLVAFGTFRREQAEREEDLEDHQLRAAA